MASSPITSWQIDGEAMETVTDFLFWGGSKITVEKEEEPEIMYGYENWTIKKVECRNIEAFVLRCWRRLESPLDCNKIQPVHPKGDQS